MPDEVDFDLLKNWIFSVRMRLLDLERRAGSVKTHDRRNLTDISTKLEPAASSTKNTLVETQQGVGKDKQTNCATTKKESQIILIYFSIST